MAGGKNMLAEWEATATRPTNALSAWNGASPFDPRFDKPRDNGDGTFSTEITVTNDAPDGGYWNIPTLWWMDGKPIQLKPEGAQALALRYEAATGNRFPRFKSIGDAESYAVNRSHGGGALSSFSYTPRDAMEGRR